MIGVLNTIAGEGQRVQYLGCKACGWRPEENKRVIPLEYAPRRLRRLRMRR